MEKIFFPTFIIILLYFTLFFNENSIVSAPSLLTTTISSGLLTLRLRFLDSFYFSSLLLLSSPGFSFSLPFTIPSSHRVSLDATVDWFPRLFDYNRLASFPGLYRLPDFSLFSKDFWGFLPTGFDMF